MPRYDAKDLETRLKGIAQSRMTKKRMGDSNFAKDAGYWDGGQCNWGAFHNFKDDCQKLAQFFTGITELKNARNELLQFNNQQEFETTKQNLLTKTTEAINGLKLKTSNNTSIAGVCIIWNDFADQFKEIINDFNKELERLKSDIEKVAYNEMKELQKLRSEERKLQNEITENERKARNETDENKKKQFIFLANNAKDKWKKILARKKELKASSLGDDFNPDAHIDIFLQKLQEKLTPKDRPVRNPRNPNATATNPNNFTGNNGNNSTDEENIDDYSPFPNNESFLKRYWKELLLAVAFSIGVYYIYHQPE